MYKNILKKISVLLITAFLSTFDCFAMNGFTHDQVYPGPEELNNRLYKCGLEEFAVRTQVATSIANRLIDNVITDYYLLEAMRTYYKDNETKVLCNGYVINGALFQDNKKYIQDCLSGLRN